MKSTGALVSAEYDFAKRKTVIQAELDSNEVESLEKLKGKPLNVVITQHIEKRTLTANAYYWVLVGEIARINKTSNAFTHNFLLRRYGTIESDFGRLWETWIPVEVEDSQIMESEFYHLRPTTAIEDGKRMYFVIKGSSRYDRKEFSRLLEGAVDEAKSLGIETETPDEIERMKQQYGV